MKKTLGIVRHLDGLGRITLPIELRRTFGLEEMDPVEIYTEGGTICLKPVKDPVKECSLCHSESHLLQVEGTTICLVCAHKVIKAVQDGERL